MSVYRESKNLIILEGKIFSELFFQAINSTIDISLSCPESQVRTVKFIFVLIKGVKSHYLGTTLLSQRTRALCNFQSCTESRIIIRNCHTLNMQHQSSNQGGLSWNFLFSTEDFKPPSLQIG